jgi:hypothetical protein
MDGKQELGVQLSSQFPKIYHLIVYTKLTAQVEFFRINNYHTF